MNKYVFALVVGITSSIFAAHAVAAPGDVDLTFGVGGTARVDIGYFDEPNDLVIQQDRKIVAVGTVSPDGGDRNVFAVRLLQNGTLDQGFGNAGIVRPNRYHQVGPRVALQADGKIVLATLGETGVRPVFLYRFESDGTPDEGFGTDGIATLSPPAGVGVSWVAGVAIVADEKIVVVLWANGPTVAFARFNADGSPDQSFDTDGLLVVPGSAIPHALAVQPDGRMVVVGEAYLPGRFYSDAFIARYHDDGSQDSSFDSDGIALVQQPSTGTGFRTVALAEDGSMFAGGREFGDNPYESWWLVAKFKSGGARDSSFGSAGLVSVELGAGDDAVNDLLVEPFGILGAGAFPSSTRGLPVAAFRQNGQFNPAFGVGGFAGTPELSAFGTARIAMQNRGSVVALGAIQSWVPSFNQNLYLTRYVGFDGAPTALNPRSKSYRLDGDAPIEAGITLALEGAVPNPSTQLSASFVLPDAEPATLLAYDVTGRVVGRREVGGLGLGRHVIQLSAPGALAPGVYLVHLIHGYRRLVSRAVVLQ